MDEGVRVAEKLYSDMYSDTNEQEVEGRGRDKRRGRLQHYHGLSKCLKKG